MVSNRSLASQLQASSKDDHDVLCRNRRVFGKRVRVRDRRSGQDDPRGQGGERAGGSRRLAQGDRREPGAGGPRGGAAIAKAKSRLSGGRGWGVCFWDGATAGGR